MTPLDLTIAPPRGPRDELAGLMFLPRSIDKVRATLPGGNVGAYRIEGLTQTMLDDVAIALDDFRQAVAARADDDAVAEYVRGRIEPSAVGRWNERIATWLPRGGNRAEALTVYPWLSERPDLILVLDVLEEDDKRAFAVV